MNLGKSTGAALAFFVLLCSLTCLRSQEITPSVSPAETVVYVVAHVDVIPPAAVAALALMKSYAAICREAPGARRFEVLREAGRMNHFTLLEVWADEAARQANEATAATRRFREQLQPMLGSPFDERLQQLAQP